MLTSLFSTLLLLHAASSTQFSTPIMGYNTCNVGCGNATFPNAKYVLRTANSIVKRGFLAAGWNYVNIDAGWTAPVRKGGLQGPLLADAAKFPAGMRNLSDTLSGMGLRFGLYTSISTSTCVLNHPGSCGHEMIDARQFVRDWNISLLKDDGCGSCNPLFLGGDWGLKAYENMATGRREAASSIDAAPVFLSTEGPNMDFDKMSARPDLYGNTHRVGHDSVPTFGSVFSQLDLASKVNHLAHNDTNGFGGFFHDLDMLQCGFGDFQNVSRKRALDMCVSHFTMWAMVKSNLLISTDLQSLPDVLVRVLTNSEVIAVHQDPLGVQAVRVSSEVKQDAHETSLWDPGTSSFLLLRLCNSSNPLQKWNLGNGTGITGGRLWTADAKGKRWCVGESSWARPGEVLPCNDPKFQKGSVPGCGCNHDGSPCCHEIVDDYRSQPFIPQCVDPFTTPTYCASKNEIGGVVGEGHGCGLVLSCEEGGTIEEIVFADFGTVAYDDQREGDSLRSSSSTTTSSCDSFNFRVNHTCTSEARGLVEYVKSQCVGRSSCKISDKAVSEIVGDPCRKVHKRLAIVARGCRGNNSSMPVLPLKRVSFNPTLSWDSYEGTSGPVPHSRYVGASSLAWDASDTDVWVWGKKGMDMEEEGGTGGTGGNGGTTGRTLHPSARSWLTRDEGTLLDDDNVAGTRQTPVEAGEWCAEAVGAQAREIWRVPLVGGRKAFALFNRSPEDVVMKVNLQTEGMSGRAWRVRNVWENVTSSVKEEDVEVRANVSKYGVALLVFGS